jgi:type IV secretion system protein TrbL
MHAGIFQQFLDALQAALDPGLTALRPFVVWLLGVLVFFESVRLAVGWLLGQADWHAAALRFVLRTGMLVWVIAEYPLLTTQLYQSFVQLGLLTGSNALTVQQFLDPGTYLGTGLQVGKVLYNTLLANVGLTTIPLALGYLLAWVAFLLGYAIMALSVFLLQVEFTIASTAALLMLPFLGFRGTGWMAQGAISYVVNGGFRFFILALLASAVFPLLTQLTGSPSPTAPPPSLEAAFVMVLASLTMAFLFVKGPAIAAGILSGSPALSAGQALQAVAGGALLATGIGAAGGAAIGTAGRALAAGGQGLVQGGTALRTAARLGAQTAMAPTASLQGTGMRTVGGLRGVAALGGGSLTSGGRALVQPLAASLRTAVQRGRLAGYTHTGVPLPPDLQQWQDTARATTPAARPSAAAALRNALAQSARSLDDGASGGARAPLD